jgi:hypothetical protein
MLTHNTRDSVVSTVLLTLALSVTAMEARQDIGGKVVEWSVFQTPALPPTTTEEMFDATHAISRVTVQRAHVEVIPARKDEPYPTIRTVYELTVDEQFKKHPSVTGAAIRVIQEGGEFQQDGTVFREVNRSQPPLVVGQSYVLFLFWKEKEGAFRLQFGADSMLEIQGGHVRRLGKRTMHDMPGESREQDFLNRLREIAATRGA